MFLIDYFIYKIHKLTNNYLDPGLGYVIFPLLLFLNIGTVLYLLGYPTWEKGIREPLLFIMICMILFILYLW